MPVRLLEMGLERIVSGRTVTKDTTNTYSEEAVFHGIANLENTRIDDLAESFLIRDLVKQLLSTNHDDWPTCSTALSTTIGERRRQRLTKEVQPVNFTVLLGEQAVGVDGDITLDSLDVTKERDRGRRGDRSGHVCVVTGWRADEFGAVYIRSSWPWRQGWSSIGEA